MPQTNDATNIRITVNNPNIKEIIAQAKQLRKLYARRSSNYTITFKYEHKVLCILNLGKLVQNGNRVDFREKRCYIYNRNES